MQENEKTIVLALRIPKSTYDIIQKRSEEWSLSVSFLVRELIVKIFDDEQKIDSIKSYRKKEKYERSRKSNSSASRD